MIKNSFSLGVDPIGKLLIKQAFPASMGILVMSLNILIDTIFVGRWIGADAIAAINVVLPVSFFIAALGMAIGMGGGSIISRALGKNNRLKSNKTFGNQISLTFIFTITFMILGLIFKEQLIPLFGGKGILFELAKIYYTIVLYGVPVLGFCMMSNNIIRAEGKPKNAMYAMIIPSITNLFLDYLLIYESQLGMYGAAWATTISYVVCAVYISIYFLTKKSDLFLKISDLFLQYDLVKEIGSLGFVTLARQAVISFSILIVNNVLFSLGGESLIASYAIISRMLMFALFPVLGITQGFIPIAGYNFGANKRVRVYEVVKKAMIYSTILASIIFIFIFNFSDEIVRVFTNNKVVLNQTPNALRLVFLTTPIIGIQLIGSAYFQSIGQALPALLLTLTRQGFFLIPLVLVLPIFFGSTGVWISFPIAEFIATIVTFIYLRKKLLKYINYN